MKYESQLTEFKNHLGSAKNILIALPAQITDDKLASALALYLALIQSGKEVSIVTEDTPKVSHSHLFGVGQVTNALPKTSGGNLTLTLEGVVASDGTVPALEKLDWFPEGQNLNLVFQVLPGQTFQPARITPSFSGGGFNLIITIGAASLSGLGGLYEGNQQSFSGVAVVNIDNENVNTQYGAVNIVDPQSSSLSEMMVEVISGLGLNMDSDLATNLLSGIYSATHNLTVNVKPDTFMEVSKAMSAGGKIPGASNESVQAQVAPQFQFQPTSQSVPQAQPAQQTPIKGPQDYVANFAPLNQVFGFPVQPEQPKIETPIQQNDNFTVPTVIGSDQSNTPSSEERPMGEYAGSSSPEISGKPDPDWLTPKIYKGVG